MLTNPMLIDPENPFANDLLDRKTFVTKLGEILLSGDQGIVLGLNGAWGTGKTTCVEFLQRELINEGHVVIVLNAWADDYISDPLVAIIASLVEDENFKRLISDERLIERLIAIGKNVMTLGVSLGVSRISRGALTPEDVTSVIEVKTDYSEILDQYTAEKKELSALRSVLVEISKILEASEDKKLIIIVDELDRCKPTYAISLFERIKHVLEVENLRVLLAFDQKQLEATVEKHYGSNIDATRYLEKMFDLIVQLPSTDLHKLLKKTASSLSLPVGAPSSGFAPRSGSIDELLEMLLRLLNATQASARELERTLTRVKFLWARSTGLRVDPVFAVVLLILRSQKYELFENIKNNNSNFSEIDDFFQEFATGSRQWIGNFQNYIETLYYIKQDVKQDQVDLTSVAIDSQLFSELPDEIRLKRQRMQSYIESIKYESLGTLSEMALAVDFII